MVSESRGHCNRLPAIAARNSGRWRPAGTASTGAAQLLLASHRDRLRREEVGPDPVVMLDDRLGLQMRAITHRAAVVPAVPWALTSPMPAVITGIIA